jgi:uncharacterized YccA/Bax inhibitor family protein
MSLGSYRQALRAAASTSIAPYGYTLTIWTTGAILTHARGVPDALQALLFMLGAVAGFSLVGIAAFGDPRVRVAGDDRRPALWSGFHFLSISIAIGVATVIAHLVQDQGAWPLGGLAATTIYLSMLAVELALAT